METVVRVAGEHEGREAGVTDADVEFFLQFADQAVFRRLAWFELTAGEFPQASQGLPLRSLADQGYTTPTPIQAQAIPDVMPARTCSASPRRAPARPPPSPCPSCTAWPRTASSRARRRPHPGAGPTRELASQIADSFKAYGRHIGCRSRGVRRRADTAARMRADAGGVDVLVATPAACSTTCAENHRRSKASILVLDEADQMLDMGFIKSRSAKIVAKYPAAPAPEPVLLGHHAEARSANWPENCSRIRSRSR
jgi:hypothetical protein